MDIKKGMPNIIKYKCTYCDFVTWSKTDIRMVQSKGCCKQVLVPVTSATSIKQTKEVMTMTHLSYGDIVMNQAMVK